MENCVQEAKDQYQQSLRNLERISNEIHQQRNQQNNYEKRCEEGETSSSIGEEQRIPVCESIQSPDSKPPTHSDNILRSCLLRTETLPAGIFANSSDQSTSDNVDENLHDQFILRPKSPPNAMIIVHSDSTPSRSTSVSSHITGDEDEDDHSGSLHVLSDEQIHHLASVYDEYSTEKGTHHASLEGMSTDLLDSLSNPLSKLVLQERL